MQNYPLEQPNSEPCLRFCWFRESSPGHMERDALRIPQSDLLLALLGLHSAQQRTTAEPAVAVDSVVAALSGAVSLEALPQWARKRLAVVLGPLTEEHREAACRHAGLLAKAAGRILAALPADREISVYLPYIDRRNWSNRFDILDTTEFVLWGDRVLPAALLAPGRMDEYNAQWLTVTSAHAGLPAELVFAHTLQVSPGLLDSLLPVPVQDLESPAGSVEVEIRLTLPTAACRAWNTAPAECEGSYFEVHAPLSVAVQSALRRWLAWYWLSNVERLAATHNCYTVLGYLASATFPGQRRTDFTYDTVTTDWMDFAFRYARRPLRALMQQIRSALIAAGQTELTAEYQPRRIGAILEHFRKDRRSIRALIAAEGDIINHILKLGFELQGAGDAIHVIHRVPRFMEGLARLLRRLFLDQDLSWLASMLLIESTNALWVAQGHEPSIRTAVRITPMASSEASDQSRLLPLQC